MCGWVGVVCLPHYLVCDYMYFAYRQFVVLE